MKTILVPTDFSKNADNALNYAIALAKKQKAKILLFHAYMITYVSPDMPLAYYSEQIKETESEIDKKLAALCERVKKTGQVKCEAGSHYGVETDAILKVIRRKKPDLVVMGTKGASGINERLIGSITANIISASVKPVIAVPEKAVFEELNTIAFATDYQPGDIKALEQLVAITKVFKPKIHVLHIADYEYNKETEQAMMEKFTKRIVRKISYKNIVYNVAYSTEQEQALESYLKKENIDLLMMTTKERRLVDILFGKAFVKKMAFHTKTPMISFYYKR